MGHPSLPPTVVARLCLAACSPARPPAHLPPLISSGVGEGFLAPAPACSRRRASSTPSRLEPCGQGVHLPSWLLRTYGMPLLPAAESLAHKAEMALNLETDSPEIVNQMLKCVRKVGGRAGGQARRGSQLPEPSEGCAVYMV